jgi:hypothetical protein
MNNWQASNHRQQKPKRKPKALQQWIAAHKILVARLREGINQDEGSSDGAFVLLADSVLA